MPGKIYAALLGIVIFSYFLLTTGFFFIHVSTVSKVDELVYNTVELASTSGELSSYAYDYLQDNINNFSSGDEGNRYFIRLKLEKQIEPGLYDSFFENTETIVDKKANGQQNTILDRPLDVGDRISIFVEDRSPTVFCSLINAPFLGYAPDQFKDIRIKSLRTAVIVNRKSNAVKGYDVIADIKTRNYGDLPAGATSLRIFVVTKSNPAGRYYSNNIYVINDPSNNDYIFPDGEFLGEQDLMGNESLVKYVQQ